MEHAFVTRSAVRRFCNRMGYQSLSDLKDSFSQIVFPSDLRHREPELDFVTYRAELDVGMIEMFADIEGRVADDTVTSLADEIARRQSVEIMCANNVTGNLQRFQQEMFYVGKIVRIASGDDIALHAGNGSLTNSLLIVVSISGMFAVQVSRYVTLRTARKLLVTAFCNDATTCEYDEVYYLSGKGNGIDRLGMYSKYAVTYFFDLLSANYLTRYADAGDAPLYGPSQAWPE